jgi:hypothetical protein
MTSYPILYMPIHLGIAKVPGRPRDFIGYFTDYIFYLAVLNSTT